MLKIARIAINIAFIGAIIAYPFVVFLGESSVQIVAFLVLLCALSTLKYALSHDNLALISAVFFGILIMLRLGGFVGKSAENLAYFYPAIVNLVFLVFFAMSLKGESIITKFAKAQNPALDSNEVRYTRKLTKIWCALFTFNALMGFALALLEDKIYWSLYCGIVAYCLVGALFVGELLYRNVIFKRRFALSSGQNEL